jgi:5'-phosphate synthase pdxT subunit
VSGKIGVLALQGDVGQHVRALAELGAHPVEIRQPEDLAGIDALVLPGGESTTMALLVISSGLRQPLAERLAAGMPAFGTCAGMILLAAEVLDGRPGQLGFSVIDISVRRNAFGRQISSFETDLDVAALGPEPVHAAFIRAPVVERAGPGVEVLAWLATPVSMGTDSGAEAGVGGAVAPAPGAAATRVAGAGRRPVACRQGPILVTSFHPELSGDLRLHDLFLKGAY